MIITITAASLSEVPIVHGSLPGIRTGHTLSVDIVTQLLSTVVYSSPDIDLEQPQEQQIYKFM